MEILEERRERLELVGVILADSRSFIMEKIRARENVLRLMVYGGNIPEGKKLIIPALSRCRL